MGYSFFLGSVPRRCETVRLLRDAGRRQGHAAHWHASHIPAGRFAAIHDRIALGLVAAAGGAPSRAFSCQSSPFREAGHVEPAALVGTRNRCDGGARHDNADDDDDDDKEDLDAKHDARSLGPVAGLCVRGAAVHAHVDESDDRDEQADDEQDLRQLVALLPILLLLLLLHLLLLHLLLLRLHPVVPTPVHHHVARREDARQLDDAEADEPDPEGLDLRPEPPADGRGEDDRLPRAVFTLLRVLYKFVGVGSRVVGRKE